MDTTVTMIEQILGTDDINRRCAVYQNLHQHLRGSVRKNPQLSDDKIRNLAATIRSDCGSETGQISNNAWELLEYILKFRVFNGDTELIFLQAVLEDDSNESVKKSALKTLEQCVLSAIIEDKNRISVILNNANLAKKLLLIIDDVCTHLPKDMCANCLVRTIMPLMFSSDTQPSLRNIVVDLGAAIVNHVNINNINEKEHEGIIRTINRKYLQAINEGVHTDSEIWSQLWTFLIKFINIKLHSSLPLTNNILRIIEKAFRNNGTSDHRLAAYACWRELINNLSLNMDHLCNMKQIKLIITPLKATRKLSRSSEVNIERFDTYLHLFKKLQDKSVLCLKEFLDFCIGPVHTQTDLEKGRKNDLILALAPKTIITILSIIGHQHNDDEICVDNEYLKFDQPIIDTNNFKDFDSLLITASYKYSLLFQESKYENRDTVIKCLWKSLFNLIENSSADVCERCYSQINNILITLKHSSKNNQQLLNIICEVAVNYKIEHNQLLETLLKIILNLACCETANINNAMIKFVSGFDKFFNFKNLETFLLDYYLKEAALINFDLFYECWLKTVDFSIILTSANRLKILFWPIIHLEKFKDPKDVCVNWMKYYQKYYQTDEERCTVLQNINKLFLNNPLLCSNVIQIIQTLYSERNITDKESNLKLLTIIESILSFPALPHHNLQTAIAIVSTYFDKSHLVYQLSDNDSILSTLCNCIVQTVNIQKDYSLLSTLQTFFESLDHDILIVFSSNLTPFLEVLLLNDDDEVSRKATKLSQLLELDTNTTTETMKISTISNSSGTNNEKEKENPITNGDKDQKNSMKKSINDVPLTRTSRMVAKVLIEQLKDINDESSSDFVKIDSEVRFEPRKLSEHQKEVLKKRRDDIPALYEDLSQSQTKDFTSNDDTTNENSTIKEDPHRNITVRNKNKKSSTENTVENRDNIETAEVTNLSTSEQSSSNIDDSTEIDNNDKSVDVTSTKEALETTNTSPNNKSKKATKRKCSRIEEFSCKDYRRKRKSGKNISIKPSNNRRSIDSVQIQRQQKLKENLQDTESDDSISHTKKKPQKHYEVLEKRQLRQRKPSSLFKKSDWILTRENIETKRLRNELLPQSDQPTCSSVDNAELIDNNDEQEEQDNNKKSVNEEENKDNKRSTISDNSLADFEVSTTLDDCNKIDFGEKLLNKSIDSADEFRKTKRKRDESKREAKSLDNFEIENIVSQDIIESSQETSEPSILQISPRKKQEKSSTKLDNHKNNVEIKGNNEETETKTTQLTDTETCTSVMRSLTPQLQLELPKKDKLTEADVEISMMTTPTLSPTSEQNNLPSSPITCDTPDRTIELINDTSDISPINTNSINEDSDKKLVKHGGNSSSNSGGGSDRSRKMLQMANTTSSLALSSTPKQSQIIKNRFRLGKIMSPSINIRKIKNPKEKDENLEVLTFTRDLPISGQAPGSGILKRKSESDEFLPNPKRKRVNFSDPATTSKKIIIKDPHEFTSDNSTKETDNEDIQIFNEFYDYMAIAIGKAAEKGLDRCQIGLLIRNSLKANEIDVNEPPSKVSLKNQMKSLTNAEAANLLSDYFETMNPNDREEIRNRAIEAMKNQDKIFEKFLLDLTDRGDALKISKKIDETIQKIEKNEDYSSDDEVDDVIINKVSKWKTEKFLDLFEMYKNELNVENNEEEHDKFLIKLMERCSNSLTKPVFINDHFRVTENFVKKFV